MKQALKTLGTGLVAAWLVATPANALAGDAEAATLLPKSTRQMTAVAKSDEATRFSINNPDGLGVFINLANPPEISPERLMSGIKGAFGDRNIKGNFQVNQSDSGDITTVIYFRDGEPYPYTLNQSFSGFQHVSQGLGNQGEQLTSAMR